MSEDKKDDKAADAKAAAPKAKVGIVAILVPALLAGGAAFGGTKLAAGHGTAHAESEAAPEKKKKEAPPPGPTIALEPFLITVSDQQKKSHPMKVTLAVEFTKETKEEHIKAYQPRIRDACLSYVRTLTYEDAVDPDHTEKVRKDIIERLEKEGVEPQRILITDFVVQ